jgi:putative endonuclease
MNFYYVYILQSTSREYVYIGFSQNIMERVGYHNAGKVKSTKAYIPFELIHYEAYKSKSDAKRRELYLKTNKGRTTLKTMLREYFNGNL